MWGLSNGGLESARQVKWTYRNFFTHCLQAEIAIKVLLDEIDQAAYFPATDRIRRRYMKSSRPRRMISSQVHRNHLRQSIGIQSVLGCAIPQGRRDCHTELLGASGSSAPRRGTIVAADASQPYISWTAA